MPFKTSGRLDELGKIKKLVQQKLLTPQKALVRLWSFVEDEFRLSKESGVFRQVVEVGGEKKLSEVVKIGMSLLYFSTETGTVGQYVKSAGTWKTQVFSETSQVEAVKKLMASFKKKIRRGYFDLPNVSADATSGRQ